MLMPSDADYQLTKQLKKSGAPLVSPFKELASWVSSNYCVHVLNVVYDTIVVARRECPRLSVVVETEADALKFRTAEGNFQQADQRRVQKQFEAILFQQGCHRFDADGLLVIFTAFESAARIEANLSVRRDEIERLQARLNNRDLWLIRTSFDTVTFFFHTDTQVKHYEAAGLRDAYSAEWARLLGPHDEFGYLQRRGITIRLDSKENFDTSYQGNWFYYDR